MLKTIKKYVKIPVFVMLRPRGGDFLYSKEEIEVMKMEVVDLKLSGADGFVFGFLQEYVNCNAKEIMLAADKAWVFCFKCLIMYHFNHWPILNSKKAGMLVDYNYDEIFNN